MEAFIHWNPDPTLFALGPLRVRWYGLFFFLTVAGAYFLVVRHFRENTLSRDAADRFAFSVFVGMLVGARLGHFLFYDPAAFVARPLDILRLTGGGLASHGAGLGMAAAVWLYARRAGERFLPLCDALAAPMTLGGVLIRLGNLFNGEILGIPTTAPWGFVFGGEAVARHPAQIYESLTALALLAVLLATRRRAWRPGARTGLFLVWIFAARFAVEFLKEPQMPFEAALPLDMGQWLSLPFVAAGLALLLRGRRGGERRNQDKKIVVS